MRVIKQRLKEMIPDCVCFLDVDDMVMGRGLEYVDLSATILAFCTERYLKSSACACELLRAVVQDRPIIALLEVDPQLGGSLATCYLLLATCYLLLATCYLLLATHYSLLTTHYSLLTTHYSLLTTHYLQHTTYYLQLTIYYYR